MQIFAFAGSVVKSPIPNKTVFTGLGASDLEIFSPHIFVKVLISSCFILGKLVDLGHICDNINIIERFFVHCPHQIKFKERSCYLIMAILRYRKTPISMKCLLIKRPVYNLLAISVTVFLL